MLYLFFNFAEIVGTIIQVLMALSVLRTDSDVTRPICGQLSPEYYFSILPSQSA